MDYIEINIFDVLIRYYSHQRIDKVMYGNWKTIKQSNCNGYSTISLNKKSLSVHRLVYYANNPDWNVYNSSTDNSIDHINGIKNDNRVENLRNVTNQQNQHNQTRARGYYFDKASKKWRAGIQVNMKTIHLGRYKTEELAHEAYLNAKLIHHKIIPLRPLTVVG
jgi:hypothetical protein